jgi:hypothetical protein
MRTKYTKKLLSLALTIIVKLGGGVAVLFGCVSVQAEGGGERFGIDISSRISQPKLEHGVVISDDRTVRVEGVNAGVNYGVSNDRRVPDEVEFIWRAVGEKETHSGKINLRSQIPNDVLNKIGGIRPRYYFSIEFFVRGSAPRFRWRLVETLPGQTSSFNEVNRGGEW